MPAAGRRTFDRLGDQFLLNEYDPPTFALKLAHKDMTLATELGRELGVPMRLANMALRGNDGGAQPRLGGPRQPLADAAAGGARRAVEIEVDPERIQEVLERDPPFGGLDPKRG